MTCKNTAELTAQTGALVVTPAALKVVLLHNIIMLQSTVVRRLSADPDTIPT